MTQTLRARGVAFSVAVLAGGMLVATPVQAAAPVPVPPGQPYGTITSTTGLNERVYPSTDAAVRSTLTHGTKAGLRCKVRAQQVGGNETWYLLRDRPTWVSAAHVSSTGNIPLCRDVSRTTLETTPTVRAAMG
ncbi:SH3 domain-containing protein [Streptomyces sp. NPDC002537]